MRNTNRFLSVCFFLSLVLLSFGLIVQITPVSSGTVSAVSDGGVKRPELPEIDRIKTDLDSLVEKYDDARQEVKTMTTSARGCFFLAYHYEYNVLKDRYANRKDFEYDQDVYAGITTGLVDTAKTFSLIFYSQFRDGELPGCEFITDTDVIDETMRIMKAVGMRYDKDVVDQAYCNAFHKHLTLSFSLLRKGNGEVGLKDFRREVEYAQSKCSCSLEDLGVSEETQRLIFPEYFPDKDTDNQQRDQGESPGRFIYLNKNLWYFCFMRFHIITLFPNAFDSYLAESIIARAIKDKKIKVSFYNPRDFTKDKWKRIDQKPYAGGPGMVLQAEPVIKAVQKALGKIKQPLKASSGRMTKSRIIWLSPGGTQFTTEYAKKAAKKYTDIIIICGRYEGIDARVKKVFKVEEISIGPFVLTGGELPAEILIDCISRQVPGVLGSFDSLEESRVSSHDVYTRPEVFEYKKKKYRVPKVLLSGDHKKIEAWKQKR